MNALSVIEPDAYSIFHLGRDVESHAWPTEYRGPLVICSSNGLRMFEGSYRDFREKLPFELRTRLPLRWEHFRPCLRPGMALGIVDLVDCVPGDSTSHWAKPGRFHWLLENPRSFDRPFRVRHEGPGFWEIDEALVTAALGAPASQPASSGSPS